MAGQGSFVHCPLAYEEKNVRKLQETMRQRNANANRFGQNFPLIFPPLNVISREFFVISVFIVKYLTKWCVNL